MSNEQMEPLPIGTVVEFSLGAEGGKQTGKVVSHHSGFYTIESAELVAAVTFPETLLVPVDVPGWDCIYAHHAQRIGGALGWSDIQISGYAEQLKSMSNLLGKPNLPGLEGLSARTGDRTELREFAIATGDPDVDDDSSFLM